MPWQLQPGLSTRFAAQVSPENAWPDYPRPQMVRDATTWHSLNGLWQYAITTDTTRNTFPAKTGGNILVPYPIESALSGVKKPLQPNEVLWYKRSFMAPARKGQRLLLHFGAVDWQATVFVNGTRVARHTGGYDPFTVDITTAVQDGDNTLTVKVWDPTDTGNQPHGKQSLHPRFILYTAVSGIWQSVWWEIVPEVSVASLYFTPDIDKGILSLCINTRGMAKGYTAEVIARQGAQLVGTAQGLPGDTLQLSIAQPLRLWSPKDPFLYDLTVRLLYQGKVVDTVGSYFGMRQINIQKDERGIERVYLNHQYTYQLGVLDQGYWPDGLYTAATDSALQFDISAIQQMGFNVIRKHIKVEPARWYYHCDRMGMMVWQDMPSWWQEREMPADAKRNFESEAASHLANLHNYPSIVLWCLFNEDWGSFDQARMAAWMKATDPSRLLNAHTGSFKEDWTGSQFTDRHLYPDPAMPPYQKGKAMVCGEFGGTMIVVPGHDWLPGKHWGHATPPGFTFQQRYRHWTDLLKIQQREGLSGSIFTEPFDVEIEQNGLMTYDREVFKMPVEKVRAMNAEMFLPWQ